MPEPGPESRIELVALVEAALVVDTYSSPPANAVDVRAGLDLARESRQHGRPMAAPAPTGVLLIQLGTPDEPTTPALRRYLRQFLNDPRVVDVNPLLWKPLLHGVILRTRPRRSAALYKRVWTDEGSPLLVHTQNLTAGVAQALGDEYLVKFGMIVGNPALGGTMDELMTAGCRDVIVLPLFPQFSSATTASAFDAVAKWTETQKNLPSLHFVRSFPDHPAFIEALRQSVVDAGVTPTKDEPLLISFHGIPKRYVAEGDPYAGECDRTADALAKSLGLEDDVWRIVYQSRFGRDEWLQPYADATVGKLPSDGVTSISVITPSFVADCLETIDEIGRELRETFEAGGGKGYTRVDCINAGQPAIDAIAQIVRDARFMRHVG